MKDKFDEDYKEEIHELTNDEIDRMTVEQMQQKLEQNKKQIKKANILNPLLSAAFIGFGVFTAIFAPGIGQWGFPVIAGAALASSNGWAVEVNVKLKNENKKLERQMQIKPLKQKIHQIEQEISLNQQTKTSNLSSEHTNQTQPTYQQTQDQPQNNSEQDLSM